MPTEVPTSPMQPSPGADTSPQLRAWEKKVLEHFDRMDGDEEYRKEIARRARGQA